jgi:hypothetical protein
MPKANRQAAENAKKKPLNLGDLGVCRMATWRHLAVKNENVQ